MPHSTDRLETVRERLIDDLYRAALPFGVLAVVGGALRNFLAAIPGQNAVPAICLGLIGLIHLVRRRIAYRTRALLFFGLLTISATNGLLLYGIASPALFLFPSVVVLAWLILETRGAVAITAIASAGLAIGAGVNLSAASMVGDLVAYNRRPEFWFNTLLVMALCGGLLLGTVRRLFESIRERQDELLELNEQLEQRILQRTEKLERSREDLQAFSYAVSHDLRAPLRAIDGFANVLREDHFDRMDDDGRHAVSRILAGTRRMSDIIEAFLGMASLERQVVRWEEASIDALVLDIRGDLDEVVKSRSQPPVEWIISSLPPARTDASLIRQVLANLMSNAVKFSMLDGSARVEIFAEHRPDGIWYAVKDSGPGLEANHTDKLFQLFQRAHGPEVEGMGIGLATVKRILDRLDGTIQVESTPGHGALFRFRPGPAALQGAPTVPHPTPTTH